MSDEGFVDNTVCKYNLHRLLHTVRKLIRECDDADIDYEPYIDLGCLWIVIKQLECCLENKEKLKK